ncbi:hypothetical protein LQ327_09580 [Actinomycetospora endophytica]|uniref:Uncharacterized protein n=1 Tax=Actinomycetospora endophytica TaxID=2291215 RepID=A0ABS8P8A4_9PSEU|nr:hypothetical protein [Actinomycetospora endophytica]MCD2193631.1 hypothetical protein [Actinomycetospora endophytica]
MSRPADPVLKQLIEDGGPLVLAHGPRLAGTSRALVHAARRRIPDHRSVKFPETVRGSLTELVARAGRWVGRPHGVVIWLDDAHLALLAQIDRDFLRSVPDGLRLLVTTRQAVIDSGALPEHTQEALEEHRVVFDTDETPGGPAPRHRVVEQLARARDQLTPEHRRVPALALLRAAVDWDRYQIPFPLDRGTLRQLAMLYCRDLEPAPDRRRDAALDALLDALVDVPGRGWLSVTIRDGLPHHRPHPLLTAAAEEPATAWITSQTVWQVYAELPATALHSTTLVARVSADAGP